MSDREQELLSAADKFIRAHQHWVDSPDANLITQAYEDALIECVNEFSDGDLPANCRALAAAVDDLGDEWKAYEGYVSQSSPMPKNPFWNAVQKLVDERRGAAPEERKPIEPVRLLIAQKVPLRQIALMYAHNGNGPFLRNGRPMEHLIIQEAKKPGSVIPEDWVHPADEARAAESKKLNERRLERLSAKRPQFKPCPETTEELLRQKVFPNQIAQMRGIPVAEVMAEARRLGIPTTGTAKEALELSRNHNPALPAGEDDSPFAGIDDEDETVDDESPEVEQAIAEVEAEIPTLEEQILERAASGLKAADVAKELGCSVQKASSVIRRATTPAKEPESANA